MIRGNLVPRASIRKVIMMGGGVAKNKNRAGETKKKNSCTKKFEKKIRAETFQ